MARSVTHHTPAPHAGPKSPPHVESRGSHGTLFYPCNAPVPRRSPYLSQWAMASPSRPYERTIGQDCLLRAHGALQLGTPPSGVGRQPLCGRLFVTHTRQQAAVWDPYSCGSTGVREPPTGQRAHRRGATEATGKRAAEAPRRIYQLTWAGAGITFNNNNNDKNNNNTNNNINNYVVKIYLIISADVVVLAPELQPWRCPDALSEAPVKPNSVEDGTGARSLPERLVRRTRETARIWKTQKIIVFF